MAIPNCSTCVHRRPIISENGLHYVCALSSKSASNCIKGNKSRFEENPKLAWKRINDGFSDLCNAETYQRTCPFCKREHEQRMYINIICQCGGKYYFNQGFWLDRKTGERKTDSVEKML